MDKGGAYNLQVPSSSGQYAQRALPTTTSDIPQELHHQAASNRKTALPT